MEPLLKQLRQFPAKFAALPASFRWGGIVAILGSVALALAFTVGKAGDEYQYAFTNLSPEDSAEATTLLTGSGIPHRLEAGGAALAVPANKVYDARLLLAAAGLPRGGGVGFELFDKGDIGVSEFTKKVNLGRALEGELARTIGRLTEVRSARVHLTLAEKGLFRDEDRKAAAAVVLNVKPGMTLDERDLAGIRHLVASAVPGLTVDGVTIVDSRGGVLLTQDGPGQAAATRERQLEQDMEHRLVTLLEPVVGAGAVVARVTALIDDAEVSTSAEVVDPDQTAVRTEHKVALNQQQETVNGTSGVAGAAANTVTTAIPYPAGGPKSSSTTDDETRSFEVSKTVTTTVNKVPRLKRLSVAILLDGVAGKPRPDAEVTQLGDLAKRAVGFDALRGDQFDISSAAFSRSTEDATPAPAPKAFVERYQSQGIAIGAAILLLAIVFSLVRLSGRTSVIRQSEIELLQPGVRVSEAQAALEGFSREAVAALPPAPPNQAASPIRDADTIVRDRARELASLDPTRATYLIRAWIASDQEEKRSPLNV